MKRVANFWNFLLTGNKSSDTSNYFEKGTRGAYSFSLYVINNPDGTPRWVFPSECKRPLFLKFYPATSKRSSMIRFGFTVLFYLGLIRLLAKKVVINMSEEPYFHQFLNDPSNDFAVFAGTVGPNRKVLLYQRNKQGKGFYTKISYGLMSGDLVQNEISTIQKLDQLAIQSFAYPSITANGNHHVELGEINTAKSSKEFTTMHLKALLELYNKGISIHSICNSALKNRIKYVSFVQSQNIVFVELRKSILKTFHHAELNDIQLRCALGHGDFTSWNTAISGGKLKIIDWELGGTYPVLYDVFHFIIQQQIMNSADAPEAILNKVILAMERPEMLAFCSHNKVKWKNQFMAYLLYVSSYYFEVYTRQENLHPQAIRAMKIWTSLLDKINMYLNNITIREVFISKLFTHLNQSPYALMKNNDTCLADLHESSDLDLFIKKTNTRKLIQWIEKQPEIVKRYKHTTSYMSVLSLHFNDGSFLSIDLIHQLKRKSLEYMSVNQVIATAILSRDGIKIPRIHFDLQYMVLFYFLNHSPIPKKYYSYVLRMDKRQQLSILQYLKFQLGFAARTMDDFFSADFARIAPKVEHKVRLLAENNGWSRLMNQFNYLLDSFKKLLKGNGLVLSFSGVDGAGKSTVISHVKEILETRFRKKVVVLRHRPSILPILSAWRYGKKEAEARAASTLPRKGRNINILSSLFRFHYYLVDFLIGQVIIWFKHTLRGDIILYDRYYFDFIEDPERSNIRLPRWFRKLFYRFIYKPKINVFLHANAEVILKRKQELSLGDIEHLTASYKALFEEYSKVYSEKYVAIENDDLEITLQQIESLYISAA